MSFPAFPAADPKPRQSQNTGPPIANHRGPSRRSMLLLGGVALFTLGFAVLGAFALRSKGRAAPVGSPHEPSLPPQRTMPTNDDDQQAESSPLAPPETMARAPQPEPESKSQLEATAQEPAQEQWPPARAFTARCKAPGGGCVEQCTPLAGGRCLDPCFIHTAECSRDCMQHDGTCGWPPPDAE